MPIFDWPVFFLAREICLKKGAFLLEFLAGLVLAALKIASGGAFPKLPVFYWLDLKPIKNRQFRICKG